MEKREAYIIAQVATKGAIDVCVARGDVSDEALGQTAVELQALIFGLAEDTLANRMQAAVEAAFPPVAAAPAAAPPQNLQQVMAPAAPAGGVPPQQPLHPGAPLEVQWADAIVYNPGDWYDNRGSKRNPAGPDFRHKTMKTADGANNLALWINGKVPTPAWVHQALAGAPVG